MSQAKIKRRSQWKLKSCDLCGRADRLKSLDNRSFEITTRRYIFEIMMEDVICENCGFVFARRIPENSFLFDYYKDAHSLCSEYRIIGPDYVVEKRLELISEYLPTGGSILEIGAGSGSFCDILKERGYKAEGLDPLDNEGKNDVAQDFIAGDVQTVPQFPRYSFDGVVSYYVLEHVVDACAWFSEVSSYLKENGIIIIEVPDFSRNPFESLNHEHFLHFTPYHLEMLMQRFGFKTLTIETQRASRYFGFVAVGCLKDRKSKMTYQFLPSDSESNRLIELNSERYNSTKKIRQEEIKRNSAIVAEIINRIKAQKPRKTKVYLWAANRYASDLAKELKEKGAIDPDIVDSSATKIGQLFEGFTRPIRPPIFEKMEEEYRILVLCSPAYNKEIMQQIEEMGLFDITIIDGITGK